MTNFFAEGAFEDELNIVPADVFLSEFEEYGDR
jgi:hypothetical protein